jgi:phospholipase/carboxylesterase
VEFRPDRIERYGVELEQSRNIMAQFISEATDAYDADPKRVYLMGFSQGSIMSVAVMLTQPEILAGIVVQSGGLPSEVLPKLAARDRFTNFPVMVTHGISDNVLPVGEAHALRDFLQTLAVKLDYREYPMRHEISDQSLDDVCGWLMDQLNNK